MFAGNFFEKEYACFHSKGLAPLSIILFKGFPGLVILEFRLNRKVKGFHSLLEIKILI